MKLASLSSDSVFLFVIAKINKIQGAGSGYLTAIFALLVGETGRAVGVEHISELTEKSVENVQKCNAAHLLTSDSLSLHTGGRFGRALIFFYMIIMISFSSQNTRANFLQMTIISHFLAF